jgi:uncharacterized Rmd1/YagE family protein
MRFLKGRGKTKGAAPKLFDECIYSPYTYRKDSSAAEERRERRERSREREAEEVIEEEEEMEGVRIQSQPQRRFSDSALEVEETRREDLIDMSTAAGDTALETGEPSQPMQVLSATESTDITTPDLDTTVHIPEIFLFEYGVVVLWGMSLQQEQRFLKELSKFEQEKLGKDDVQTEEFNFYYTREYQARIYNDFISLREKKNYMTKLAISHALAQSVKVRTSARGEDVFLILTARIRHPSTKTS